MFFSLLRFVVFGAMEETSDIFVQETSFNPKGFKNLKNGLYVNRQISAILFISLFKVYKRQSSAGRKFHLLTFCNFFQVIC